MYTNRSSRSLSSLHSLRSFVRSFVRSLRSFVRSFASFVRFVRSLRSLRSFASFAPFVRSFVRFVRSLRSFVRSLRSFASFVRSLLGALALTDRRPHSEPLTATTLTHCHYTQLNSTQTTQLKPANPRTTVDCGLWVLQLPYHNSNARTSTLSVRPSQAYVEGPRSNATSSVCLPVCLPTCLPTYLPTSTTELENLQRRRT